MARDSTARRRFGGSSQQGFDDVGFAGDARQALVEALESIGQSQVVEAEEVEQRRLQVVDVHRVSDRGPAEFVGLAVDVAFADSAAGHEDRKRVRVMVAAGRDRLILLVLSERGSTELAGDDDQRFVQQAALFQVVDQGGDGLVTEPSVERQLDVEPLVVVPRSLDEMHESDAALDQSAGQKAIGGKGAVLIRTAGALGLDDRVFAVDSVRIERSPRLARKIGQFGRRGLHSERKLVAGDAAEDLRVVEALVMGFIELTERIETGAAKVSRKPIGVLQIEHRLSLSTKHAPFIRRGKKTAGPVSRPATRATPGGEHDIAGK